MARGLLCFWDQAKGRAALLDPADLAAGRTIATMRAPRRVRVVDPAVETPVGRLQNAFRNFRPDFDWPRIDYVAPPLFVTVPNDGAQIELYGDDAAAIETVALDRSLDAANASGFFVLPRDPWRSLPDQTTQAAAIERDSAQALIAELGANPPTAETLLSAAATLAMRRSGAPGLGLPVWGAPYAHQRGASGAAPLRVVGPARLAQPLSVAVAEFAAYRDPQSGAILLSEIGGAQAFRADRVAVVTLRRDELRLAEAPPFCVLSAAPRVDARLWDLTGVDLVCGDHFAVVAPAGDLNLRGVDIGADERRLFARSDAAPKAAAPAGSDVVVFQVLEDRVTPASGLAPRLAGVDLADRARRAARPLIGERIDALEPDFERALGETAQIYQQLGEESAALILDPQTRAEARVAARRLSATPVDGALGALAHPEALIRRLHAAQRAGGGRRKVRRRDTPQTAALLREKPQG